MRIAIFHNFMDNIGGAEKFVLSLAKELNADIYTTNFDMDKIKKMGFFGANIMSIGKVPINAPFRQQLALWRFRRLNLGRKYNFYIIGGDWAVSGAVNHRPNLWYVHSPVREMWDLYKYTRKNMVVWHKRLFFDIWVLFNRLLYRKYVEFTDEIMCNSQNVQKRVKKYLKRDSIVGYTLLETKNYKYKRNGDYWLSVNRLIGHKRVDLQIKAFEKLPNEKLIIVGSYEKAKHFLEYANYIKSIKPKNVEIRSWVDDKELIELYSNCKGFITTARDEDLGFTPIESMASGKPVIAPNEGGYKETVINGKTGILIDDINIDKLVESVKKVNDELRKNPLKYKNACIKQAKKFGKEVFAKRIKGLIDEIKNENFND